MKAFKENENARHDERDDSTEEVNIASGHARAALCEADRLAGSR